MLSVALTPELLPSVNAISPVGAASDAAGWLALYSVRATSAGADLGALLFFDFLSAFLAGSGLMMSAGALTAPQLTVLACAETALSTIMDRPVSNAACVFLCANICKSTQLTRRK